MHRASLICLWTLILIPALSWPSVEAQGTRADYERAAGLANRLQNSVAPLRIEPHWYGPGDAHLWYRRDLLDGEREYVSVAVATGERTSLFDHEQLAKALSTQGGKTVTARRLPLQELEALEDGARLRFRIERQAWELDRRSGALTAVKPREPVESPRGRRRSERSTTSPNGRLSVVHRNHNLVLRGTGSDIERPLTTDGTAENAYDPAVYWSPDSTRLAALQIERAQSHLVHLIESSPRDQVQPRLHSFEYLKPGDKIAHPRLVLFEVTAPETPTALQPENRTARIPDELFPNPWSLDSIHWSADSRELRFSYNQRGHQVLRILGVDAATRGVRAIVDEVSPTFLDYAGKYFAEVLEDSQELIWMSERSGWNHLYLYDLRRGVVKNPITQGAWVVRGVDHVDPQRRQITFRASGVIPNQDPYYIHVGRVDFEGTNLVWLTEGDGTHAVTFAPGRQSLVDTWSRVDHPPVITLRRADGTAIVELERADDALLRSRGWRTPERFTAKGRDGQTEIYGVIWRPTNFDSARKYPVVESIYAGPHGSFVPKAFSEFHGYQMPLAELGFVVVQMDGMGTSHRSKAFHDVCWKNLGDSGFADRIAWMKAAAARFPEMDLERVGIYGGSAGGQSAVRALLAHGDFYKAAVADCGCHDNRMDKIWWNELWMGYPVGPHYAEQSNVTQAHRLQGKLLLVVGELDRNVDPASTLQVVDALVRADKDFELLVIPGAGHGSAESPYGKRRRMDFFVRHLMRREPRADAESVMTP